MEKKYHWHKISERIESLELNSNGLMQIEVDGKKICVARLGDALMGCANACPHASGRMSEGFIDAMGNIVCPLHRYRFDLKTGRNVSGEGYFLKTYPIEKRDEGVFIGMEEKKGLFGL